MKQVVKILIVLLIGSMMIIPFGKAQNRGRGHQGNAIVSNGMRTAPEFPDGIGYQVVQP